VYVWPPDLIVLSVWGRLYNNGVFWGPRGCYIFLNNIFNYLKGNCVLRTLARSPLQKFFGRDGHTYIHTYTRLGQINYLKRPLLGIVKGAFWGPRVCYIFLNNIFNYLKGNCVLRTLKNSFGRDGHTHIHTHTYTHIHTYTQG
jgi:hypothetical protein